MKYKFEFSSNLYSERDIRRVLFENALHGLQSNMELILDNGTDFEDDYFECIRNAVYGKIENVINDLRTEYGLEVYKVYDKRYLEKRYIKEWSNVIKNNMDFNDKEDRKNVIKILNNMNNIKNWSCKKLEKELKEFD